MTADAQIESGARAEEAAAEEAAPRAAFVRLAELEPATEGEEGGAWGERARWIKYEEDVEEEAGRWGRPHVAPLPYHSLRALRRALEGGALLLELRERELGAACWRAVLALTERGLLPERAQHAALATLLLPQRHLPDDRSRASRASLQLLRGLGARRSLVPAPSPPAEPAPAPAPRRHSALPRIGLAPRSLSDARRRRGSEARKRSAAGVEPAADEALLRRIPADAEAAVVLVAEVPYVERPAAALLRLESGAPMPALTGLPLPVRFLVVLLAPGSGAAPPLELREVGRSMATLLAHPRFLAAARRASEREHLLAAVDDYLDEAIVLPAGDWDRKELLPLEELRAKSEMIRRRKPSAPTAAPAPAADEKRALLLAESAPPPRSEPEDPLSRTGRPFGGVVRDMRRRYPHYASDFTEALNGQCVAAAIFMYFAALSSAITFGGLLADKTHGQIGISETLVFTCAGGVVFALAAGQPMMITGATGPLLLLDESLARFCRAYELDFLTARMYAGLWMVAIALAVAAVEGSVAVKRITRFTEDIFAFLISLIFISEPVSATLSAYRAHPLGADYCGNCTASVDPAAPAPDPAAAPQPNTALWSTMLTLGTFALAYYLRVFRNGKFLGRAARRALGDFGVPIAIVCAVGVAALVPVWTETLRVPDGLTPTAARPWFVPLAPAAATLPAAAVAAMLLPALMVYIIVFMETHIAELIVDKPERKLRKGSGFHMDIVVVSLVNAMCGLFGAPWQCVATVRSVSHVAALTVMSTAHAPGDKPHILHVKEQRLTGLVVAVLVGLSVLGARWLRLVPMAVLFGVFLYMGVSALAGIQLWDRLLMLLKPAKHHPQAPYVRRVPTARMHLYTLVQTAGLALLYAVKASRFSLALPFFLVLMVPLRMSLARCFSPAHLRALDGAQRDIDEDDEPDFHREAPLPG